MPVAEDRGSVIVDGLLRIALSAGKASELEIDEAVSGPGFAQIEEVVHSFLRVARVGQGLGEKKLLREVFTVGERDAERGDGLRWVALQQRHLAALCPGSAQVFAVGFEGSKKQVGENEERDGDAAKGEKDQGIAEKETTSCRGTTYKAR